MSQTEFSIHVEHDKVLADHCDLQNTTTVGEAMQECLGHCLANCLCTSFQICNMKECQLCSSDKYSVPARALRTKQGCNNYVFKKQTSQVRIMMAKVNDWDKLISYGLSSLSLSLSYYRYQHDHRYHITIIIFVIDCFEVYPNE